LRKEIFICFADADGEVAFAVARELEKNGFSCYLPLDIDSSDKEELKSRIDESSVAVFIFTDEANMSATAAKQLEIAFNSGLAVVTFRLSNSLPIGRLGTYINVPHVVDARAGSLQDNINKLVDVVREVREIVYENRERRKKRFDSRRIFSGRFADKKNLLPGYSGKGIVALFATAYYALTSLFLLMTYHALFRSENLLEDAVVAIYLTLAFYLPVAILGNVFKIRDKITLLRKRNPVYTISIIIIIELTLFFSFNLLLKIL
jgi:hypothetical protein